MVVPFDTMRKVRAMEARFDMFTNAVSTKFMQRIANASIVVHKSLPTNLLELVSLRVSQINGCGWCVDMHTKEAAAAGESPVRLNLVATWRESTVFDEAERAALAFAEEGTRIADASEGVSDATWANVREHYDDDQLAALVCLIGLVNATNRFAVIVHQRGGSYEAGMFAAMVG